MALHRHSTGTTRSPHDLQLMQKDLLLILMQKDSFFNVAPAAVVTLPVECRSPARYRNSVKVEVPV